jgi:rubredoxin
VTDRNPDFDPADIRGAARSDPGAEPGDDESVPGNYPTHHDGRDRANTCATCWQEIPEGQIKCPHCASEQISESTNDEESAPLQEWSFGRVAVAVVSGNSTYHARAMAAAAFGVSDAIAMGPDVSRGEVKLRAAFETAPARHLTDGWPELPSEASLDESSGEMLFETAVDQTDWDGEGEPRLYREDGQPVTTRDELETLQDEIEAADEQYWVVPGIVQRYAAMPDPEDIDDPLYCVSCAQVTGHDAVGKDGIAGHPPRRRTIWACKTCGQPRHEPQRDSDTPAHTGYEHLPDDVSPEDIHGDEPDFEAREFQSQIEAYRERYGCFPWEN